jgi:hypothetical protein
MFNNSLFNKEARLKMAEREQEAETYRLQNQLGFSDRRAMRWVFGFFTLIATLACILILF